MRPTPRPGIMDITAYVGGRAQLSGVKTVFKLSSNESPLGPSPAVAAAMDQAKASLHIYPEGSARILREAIAAAHGLDAERIVCSGDGSDMILTMLANAYLQPGDEALFSEHAFLVYRIITLANSAVPVTVPERLTNHGLVVDVDAMLAAVTPKTRIVFIANPNNPTGSYLSRDEMARLHAGLPKDVLLVIDAAYAEYVTAADYDAGIALVSRSENVVMTRTFSKIFGMAALRLGWCYAPPAVVDVLNRIRGPFNVSTLQQLAGVAAIGDRAHIEKSVAHNSKWLAWVTDEIRKTGLRVDDSAANFVLIHFPEGPKNRAAADEFLNRGGVILRAVEAYGLPDALRMSIGTEEENRRAVALIQDFMAS
ncbi:MAG: histidinol-phosphate transaminase [Alphaproteobacteria bacterium]|nr:histidinol-phosphate transaminase [Alphaproteobacteria bacterium]